jgi:hypothetical protein
MKKNIAGWRTAELIYAAMIGAFFSHIIIAIAGDMSSLYFWLALAVVLVVAFLHYLSRPEE